MSIALYDQWGRHLHRVHRFTASSATFGPNGSQDHATGYLRGILDTDVIGSLCGTSVMVRAYDARAAAWSNMLDIDTGC